MLVETGFLLALNPLDRNHEWAMRVLEEARNNNIVLHVSPAALIELALYLKSRGLNYNEISEVFEALNDSILYYTIPYYPKLTLKHLRYAAELQSKYSELTFFDSIHASIALTDKLVYYDLDTTVKKIIEYEKKR